MAEEVVVVAGEVAWQPAVIGPNTREAAVTTRNGRLLLMAISTSEALSV
jgi:hypothetical protein